MTNNEPDLGRYARRIEEAWIELQGRAIVLSPRDWDRVEDWFNRGVPLPLILETIAEARHRLRGVPRPPGRLSYIAGGVEDSWAAIIDGRRNAREPEEEPTPAPENWHARWQMHLEETQLDSKVRERVEHCLARSSDTVEESVFRRSLAERLTPLLDEKTLGALDLAADQRLERHRERLSVDEYRKQRLRERDVALLRHFGL